MFWKTEAEQKMHCTSVAILDWLAELSRLLRRQFSPPFGMYGLLALTSKEYAMMEHGELRGGRGIIAR